MTYWLTLAISAEDLAAEMECSVEEIESGDYIGVIRDFGEIVSLKKEES